MQFTVKFFVLLLKFFINDKITSYIKYLRRSYENINTELRQFFNKVPDC
jgi:hypothetical protein